MTRKNTEFEKTIDHIFSDQQLLETALTHSSYTREFGRDDMEVSVYGNDDRAVLVSRFDNLGKGASGAAIQNMNLVLGYPEDEGLVRRA